MQKLLFTLSLGILVPSFLSAQTPPVFEPYGSYIDLQGELVHEYADQNYRPANLIEVSFNPLTTYSPGTYYPPGGKEEKGLFLYEPGKNHFLFKENLMAKKDR